MDQLGKDAIEPDAHDEGAFPRLEVDIARSCADGIEEDAVDEVPNLDALLGRFRLEVLDGVIHNDLRSDSGFVSGPPVNLGGEGWRGGGRRSNGESECRRNGETAKRGDGETGGNLGETTEIVRWRAGYKRRMGILSF